jgi:hypothetical protein
MKLMKYFFIFAVFSIGLISSFDRLDNFVHNQKRTKKSNFFLQQNKKKQYERKSTLFKKKCRAIFGKKIGRPYGRPGGYGWHTSPLSANPFEGNGTGGNNFFDSLATMAPIAMAMYCFNSAPRLTMVTLTTLLLFIAGSANE